jgi:hypothetical protein
MRAKPRSRVGWSIQACQEQVLEPSDRYRYGGEHDGRHENDKCYANTDLDGCGLSGKPLIERAIDVGHRLSQERSAYLNVRAASQSE